LGVNIVRILHCILQQHLVTSHLQHHHWFVMYYSLLYKIGQKNYREIICNVYAFFMARLPTQGNNRVQCFTVYWHHQGAYFPNQLSQLAQKWDARDLLPQQSQHQFLQMQSIPMCPCLY